MDVAGAVMPPRAVWPERTSLALPVFVACRHYEEGGHARLSLSESGFGCSPLALRAVVDEAGRLHRYPDAGASRLASAVAQVEGLTAEHVIVGNGIDELLLISALALVDPLIGAVVSDQTYPGHGNAVRATRCAPVVVPLNGMTVDVGRMLDAMAPGRVVYVCNPHNPTGAALPKADLDRLAAAAIDRDAVLVVDEAYIEFTSRDETTSAIAHVRAGRPVVVLRTFSKIHGLAGLRCGYAVAPPSLRDEMRRVKSVLVFNVNRLALAAAEASLRDLEFIDSVRERTRAAVKDVEAWLKDQPWAAVHQSVTNFTLVELPWLARRVGEELAQRGVLVRDCTDLGLPYHVRVSAGAEADMEALKTGLAEVADLLGHSVAPELMR